MATDWQIGDRIQNRWEIHKILRGGMGIVYIVYDHEWQAPLAAKTFQDEIFARNPVIARRFTEGEALAWINLDVHQNIAQARFVDNIQGKPFLFLEYVSGGDLSGWIGTPRLMEDLSQVLLFAIHFCDGMIHALSKGIKAHRDIKPQNCLITEDKTLKVTDFGLAKIFDDMGLAHRDESSPIVERLSFDMTRTGIGAGTPTHMAPEQFDDAKRVDVRADIYSFGVMLYQMIKGRLPFVGRTWEEFARLHKTEEPPTLSGQLLEINAVVQGCLAKNLSDRFLDFGAVREELGGIYERLTGESAPQSMAGEILNAANLNNKGMSLANLGRREEALACYDRALEINAHDSTVWTNKGVSLAELGRMEEALTCHERAIALDPRNEKAWSNKGGSLHELGRYEQALTCYEHAIALDPRDEIAWMNIGLTLGALGRNDEALTCYERAIVLSLNYADAWSNKGVALAMLARHREAIVCYEQALELNPRLEQAWFSKGVSLGALARNEEAIACYDHAIALNPQYAKAWLNKGSTLGNCGCLAEALICLQKANELGDPLAAQAIALCRQMLGQR